MSENLTPDQQKKVSAVMSILGSIAGKKKTPAQQRARRKSIAKARKFRRLKALKAA